MAKNFAKLDIKSNKILLQRPIQQHSIAKSKGNNHLFGLRTIGHSVLQVHSS